jgi:hypothetical protein
VARVAGEYALAVRGGGGGGEEADGAGRHRHGCSALRQWRGDGEENTTSGRFNDSTRMLVGSADVWGAGWGRRWARPVRESGFARGILLMGWVGSDGVARGPSLCQCRRQ